MEELIGFTITGFEVKDDGEWAWPRFYAQKGEERIIIEVSRDEEGNGPGTLFWGEPEVMNGLYEGD